MRMDKSENVFKNENKTPYLVHNFVFSLTKFSSKINVKNESQESNRASRASNLVLGFDRVVSIIRPNC